MYASDGSAINWMDGYLSDVYYVEDQVLLPTVFGAEYFGAWGPLNSTVVKANIDAAFNTEYPSGSYNTSRVWSDECTWVENINPNQGPYQAFNGELNNLAWYAAAFESQTFAPVGGIEATKFEIWLVNPGSFGAFTVNGQDALTTAVQTGDNSWGDFSSFIVDGKITNVTATRGSGSAGISAFRVNDKILVDGAPFGISGFYLPFNPAAQGVYYISDYVINSFSVNDYKQIDAMFNGVLSKEKDAFNFYTLDSSFTTGIPVTTGIRFWARVGGGSNSITAVFQNAGDVIVVQQPSSDGGTMLWRDVAVTNDVLIGIKGFAQSSGANNAIGAIEVDGKILVEHNNIGVDDSGNNNDFYDQDFAVGDTSQVWSMGGNPKGFDPRGTWVDAFRGFTGVVGGAGSNTFYVEPENTTTYTFPLAVSGTIGFRCSGGSGNGGTTGTITLSNGTVLNADAPANTPNIESATNLTNITGFTVYGGDSGNGGVFISTVIVNGIPLIDANLQDTVLDTPMLSYATIETGANGDLVSTTSEIPFTYLGNPGTNYYYELNGVGVAVEGGSSQLKTQIPDQVYNFGQQPFIIEGVNDSQVWSTYLTRTNGIGNVENGFNGNISNSAYTESAGSEGMTFSPPGGFSNITSMTIKYQGSLLFDGVQKGPTVSDEITIVVTDVSSFDTLVIDRPAAGASSNLFFIQVNGQCLIDTGVPLAAAYPNQLKQTWLEWNLDDLDVNNTRHVAIYNTIKSALEGYTSTRASFRANLRSRLLAANFTAAEVASVGL